MSHKEAHLQIRLLLNYLIAIATAIGIVTVFVYERNQAPKVKAEAVKLWNIYGKVHVIHRNVVNLALQGEVALGWDEKTSKEYHERLMQTDSMLTTLKNSNITFLSEIPIDTIQNLLKSKRYCLIPL